MKFSTQRARVLAPLVCAGVLLFTAAPAARAQTTDPPLRRIEPAAPTRQPQDKPTPDNEGTSKPPTPAAPPVVAANLSPRERRAQAYAKILEGQRYLLSGRGGSGLPREALQRAQAAFQQAAALDPTLAEPHTALAEIAFFYLDDMALAEREAKTAARLRPDNFGAHRILARVYTLQAGLDESHVQRPAVDKAVAELREVVRLDANDPEAWALLGEFYLLTGRNAEAVAAFTQWAAAPPAVDARFYQVLTQGRELSPDAAAARLGEALLRVGRTAEAVAAIRRALAISPDNAGYLQLLGRALETGGDASSAIDDLKSLVAANPTNSAAVSLLAQTQARAGRVDDAVATLRAAIGNRATGERPRSVLQDQLVDVLADALRYQEAVQVYEDLLKERGITDQPLSTDSDKQLATRLLTRTIELQRQAGHPDAALAAVERMRRLLGPDDPQADFQYALQLRELGKRQEALAAIRAARLKYQAAPAAQRAFLQLEARTLAELGRVDEGAALLRARLSGNPEEDFTTYAALASVYMDAGRGKQAVEAARKLLALVPADQPELLTQALVLLSSAQERAGDPKGAEESLRRILNNNPTNATALNNLGYFLAERNERLDEALDMTRRAVQSEPTNPSFLDSLGWVYYKRGQLDEAERYLSDAARRNSRSLAIQEHLGDLHQRRGRTADARAAWRKALALATEAADIMRLKGKIGDR